jgi:aspartate-semialdehyde dehydrogenase
MIKVKEKLKVGIIGATGMVGQRLLTLLDKHPWFEVALLAASERSAGKKYRDATMFRWLINDNMPAGVGDMEVFNVNQIKTICEQTDFIFSAVNMESEKIYLLEKSYAESETPVVSLNSACRMMSTVPMVIPEINYHHLHIIPAQRKSLGVKNGFIVCKPNCSIQSFVPVIHPLLCYEPASLAVCTMQAVSGAGKTLVGWPEMYDNVNPYIKGENEKSETEPLKIWGRTSGESIHNANMPLISAQTTRVPVSDGHMARVWIAFDKKPTRPEIIKKWQNFKTVPQELKLPSAPDPFLYYFDKPDRPQTRLDRDLGNGMAISVGMLKEDKIFDFQFTCLSHNTIRGAGGGAIELAELAYAMGYLAKK